MLWIGTVVWMALTQPATAAPPEAAVEAPAAPRTVRDTAALAEAQGARATVFGTLVRATPAGVDGATEGTALKLTDGALVFVAQGAPPEAWVWLVGTEVRVQGLLWSADQAKGGWPVAWLSDAEAPMPADGMPGM